MSGGYTGKTCLVTTHDPMERYDGRPIVREDDLGKEDEPTYDVMVRRMVRWAHERYGDNPPWRKPWPDPLPTSCSLDQPAGIEVDYIRDEDQDFIRGELAPNQPFVLSTQHSPMAGWTTEAWKPMDWENRAMRAVVGLIDDPSNAKLRLLQSGFDGRTLRRSARPVGARAFFCVRSSPVCWRPMRLMN